MDMSDDDPVVRSAKLWCDGTGEAADIFRAVKEYRTSALRKLGFMFVCVAATVAVAGLSLGYGTMKIPFSECYSILWDHITGDIGDTQLDYIVVKERLPRIVTALVTGCALGVSGCAMQTLLKNPLADPYTTGISSGAGFGATIAVVAGVSLVAGDYAIVVNAFVFSLIPLAVILTISKIKGADPTTMIMAGIAVMFIFNAFTTLFKLNADPDSLAKIYAWTVGTVSDAKWNSIALMAAVTVAGVAVTQMCAAKLNILSAGDDSAKSMGIDVEDFRIVLLLVVSVMVSVVVSFTGLIGFVGLVSPHICRIFVGADNRYLVISSAMFGAVLLEVADFVGRTIIAPAELQVGVVTALIGGPMFLYLIVKQRRRAW
ncbi:iron ABC transporter permease [Methanomassiliicoccales archaeon LGM-DZ1]|nr:iron ABC transporter permease [Methanomassiliicoccales archaeon LGM-DZ1]